MERNGWKSTLPLSHKSTQCNDYLPCHSGAICCYHKADYLTPTAGCVCGFAIFSEMPTLLFVEMLPSWHRLKYVCVCVDVCVWVSVSAGAWLRVCAVCVWRVGGCLCGVKAVKMEGWMTQTGQSGGRLVSGPYSHYQPGCSIWQLTESLQAPSLHSPTKRSQLQSAPLSGCLSHRSIRPLDAHLTVLDHFSGGNVVFTHKKTLHLDIHSALKLRQMIMHAASYV